MAIGVEYTDLWSSAAMVQEAEAVARAAVYDEEVHVADPRLPDDAAAVKRINDKCERLLDEFAAARFPLPALSWNDGFVTMEWFGLPKCECVLDVRNDSYILIASKHQENGNPTQSYSAEYAAKADPLWLVEHVIYTLKGIQR